MHKDIRLIALDMDGTLLNQNHEISSENKKAIENAKADGIEVVISTGRPYKHIEQYIDELNLDSYFVTINGGEVWDGAGNLLERHLLATEHVGLMWNLVNTYKTNYWAITTTGLYHNNYPENRKIDRDEWVKFGFEIADDHIRNTIQLELKKHNLEVTNSSPTNLEVNPAGINKGSALEGICKRMNLSMEQVMAIGDSLNDLAMIQKAGIGVAMGNAQETIKKAADWTTTTNLDDGVAKAIYRILR